MEPIAFIRGLQLTDSFFPVGAFAYSDGLETAATSGLITDAASLGGWMEYFLEGVFVSCEGLALVKSMNALGVGDLQTLRSIDEELTAIRTSRAVRSASVGVGKRVLSVYAAMHSNKQSSWDCLMLPYTNAAVAYAVVFFHGGLEARHAALAFGYNRLAGIVSAGLRLISIGQQQGQEVLTKMLDRLPDAVDRIHGMADEPLRSFSPSLDIQQMNHQYVYSRLFRS